MGNKYIVLLLIVGAVYFFLKYLSPLLAPVLIAVLFLTMFYPALDDMQKKFHIKKQFISVLFILLFGIVIVVAAWIVITLFMQYLSGFVGGVEDVRVQINIFIRECCGSIEEWFGVNAAAAERLMVEKINLLAEDFQEGILPMLLDHSWNYARSILSIGAFIGITVITTVMLARDYDEILDRMAVDAGSRMLLEVVVRVIKYIATFIRAQLIIMLTVGGLAMLTLGITGVKDGVVWGLLAGVLDVLPFVGTGIVLIPLALWQMLQGQYVQMAVCLVLYVACVLIREFMEPRLIGSRVGIYPVAILAAVYAGIRLFGVTGIFLGPVGLVMIQQIYRAYRQYKQPIERQSEEML